METVRILDRSFRLYLSEAEIQQRVREVAAQISRDLEGKNPLLLGVLNGAFVFAADLVRAVTIPAEISFIKVASYEGTSSTGTVSNLIGLNESLEGRTVVIVEDIIDSGLSMTHLVEAVKAMNPADVRICSLLVKPGNLKVELDVPYCCFRIPNDFIVGYGLDYDRYGRGLRDIYVVTEDGH
ncbi:MAG: hypoxanthine phosphoribosyltransferase [Bacteroidaceae bacterium]|nr:hypoxanthine phosphoribosyltransferase [Bacteroidaceae bacterium]